MGATGVVSAFLVLSLTLGRIGGGIWLFSTSLPLRDGARWRIPAALAGLFVVYLVLAASLLSNVNAASSLAFSLSQLTTYSLLLLACVGAFLVIYDTSVWAALFCCSAGYTVQNLSTGALELVWVLLGHAADTNAHASPLRLVLAAACAFATYVPTYLLVTRRTFNTGLGNTDDRSMVVMMAVVILVIIGFDLVIKWLTDSGTALGAVVLLRLFHGLACVFTLSMELELLINRRLVAERDTMERVLSERERQYQQTRGNIAAINAQVHDIRHAVSRIAASDGLGNEELRQLVREVRVYDLVVHTGNDALDTALTERRLMCERQGVSLTCVADGKALAFMAPADTYALFGGLLDAAVASDATSVSLVVREALGTTSAHVECNGRSADAVRAQLPPLADIVRRYGGTLAAHPEETSLCLDVMIPQTE